MSPLEPLSPDQRAVVSLVLQQGRSYDEIAQLLGIPAEAVQARAQAGLAALARDNGLPGEVTAPLADYLLAQQAAADAAATRGLLAESAPARAWAADVAAQLEDVAPRGLPEIPAAVPGPRPRPVLETPARGDEAPPAASRLGGVLLIAGVLAVVAVVLFLVLRGGDDSPDGEIAAGGTPSATATATPSPGGGTPQVADTIRLRSETGGKAKGTMTVYLQDNRLLFELVAQDVPPNTAKSAYAVWFTGPGDKVHRLGFINPVGKDGKLGIQGPGQSDLAAFPKLYATYANVVVSRETSERAKRPGPVVLSGNLPKGR